MEGKEAEQNEAEEMVVAAAAAAAMAAEMEEVGGMGAKEKERNMLVY